MILPMEKEPLMTAEAKARFVEPPTFDAVHWRLVLASRVSRSAWFVYLGHVSETYLVENSKRSHDGVDEVDASQDTSLVRGGEEGHEGASNDSRENRISTLAIDVFSRGEGLKWGTYAGIMQAIIQSQRWDDFRMPKPTRRVKKMLTTPDGMFISAERLGSPMMFLISVAE